MKELAKLKTVNVSAKGQIAIPADIRKMLGIKKGDRLLLTAASKKILIEKSNEITKKIEDDLSYLTKISERTAKKLWDNESDKIWDQL
ncbi:MAG: AbrB/MazE/SpoVT family DNA-binding domain-containing protein [Candidatus Nitrosotenuis sp.]